MGAHDGQTSSTDKGSPSIPKAPPGYPSTAAALAKRDEYDRKQTGPLGNHGSQSLPSSA